MIDSRTLLLRRGVGLDRPADVALGGVRAEHAGSDGRLEVAAEGWVRSFGASDRIADAAGDGLAGSLDAVGGSARLAAEAVSGGELVHEGVELLPSPGRAFGVAAAVGVVDGCLQLVDAALVFGACLVVEDGLTGRSLAVDAGGVGRFPCVDRSRADPFDTEVKDVELAVRCAEEAGQVAHSFGVAQHRDVAVIGNRPILTITA